MSTIDNIDGIYAKDTELRTGINTLRNNIINQTIKPLTVTQNGATYTADPTQGTYGYSPITVDVQEQPWQPLEDGYSNFWFELTNDTLSPWLNFSAKTEDAVIDWGDGSGEVELDTLTPTHTYAKAGKYVVKVKGVTGVDKLIYSQSTNNKYYSVLKAIECNSEINSFASYACRYCIGIEHIKLNAGVSINGNAFQFCINLKSINFQDVGDTVFGMAIFYNCASLKSLTLPSGTTQIGQDMFYNCITLDNVIVPATVTSINRNAFYGCATLNEIHIQATTPPTITPVTFNGNPSNFIIYVPAGYGNTYKAANIWSGYADHILEEGQTPNRAMLSKMKAVNDDEDGSNER